MSPKTNDIEIVQTNARDLISYGNNNINGSRRQTEEYLDYIRCMIGWRNIIYTCLTSNQTLDESHLLDLAKFLQNMAISTQRLLEANVDLCVFCRNNNEPKEIYTSHKVKDRFGRVTCPILRKFTCPLCGATKDRAHTIRYCPKLLITNHNRNGNSSGGPTCPMIEAGLLEPIQFSTPN
ncbi:putative nanos RNA binding domain [Schistosoma mansoni]|uniref:Putative nanos RNA binding domain n=1 Tax=Schistosoma mansoni TaxID=6183 RepID=G4VHK0_SCHMA|nr:putative nanos RNA binding domain [Schistosoma mansoni]|eukprot:XP_018652467.1 putative nanos RNA binding domain [Schistosoma mansoni]